MPTLVFPVVSVIERLAAAAPIRFVGIAPDLAAALNTPPRSAPAVFVATHTRGGAVPFSGPLVQQGRVTTLQLVVWVRNAGTPEAVAEEMQAVESTIDARLAGWAPSDAYTAPRFVEARDEFAQGAWYVKQIAFECQWTFSAQVQP